MSQYRRIRPERRGPALQDPRPRSDREAGADERESIRAPAWPGGAETVGGESGYGGAPGRSGWASSAPGVLWLGLACVAAGLFFREGLADLWAAWQTPEYSHGPLIPLISGYLFLRHLKYVPPDPGPVTDRWPGVLVLVLALLLGLFGNIAQIEKFVAVALIVWVGGIVLVSLGWRRGRRFWPEVLHLGFMLPLPFFLYWKVSIALQFVSSGIGVDIIRMAGIPVFLDGNIIDLGVYKLHVAEACSGLRYLFPIMSFTYVFAVLYQGSVWHKIVLLLAAIPIAVMMNSVRIGVIGVMVDAYGIEHAEGFMHFFEGWVVFLLCILVMIGLARLMQRLSGDRRSLAEVLDVQTAGLGRQLTRVRDVRPSAALIGTSVAFAVAAMLWSPLTRPEPPVIQRDPFLLFPRELGEWRGIMHPDLPREITDVLKADDYLLIGYEAAGQAAPVDLFVAWYRDQTRAQIHTPEVCIPAGGWEMSSIGTEEIVIRADDGQSVAVPVNRAIIQKGLEKQLVYYWFDQSGRRIASDYAAKAWLIRDALESGRTDGALVRLTTPVAPGEPVGSAEARLRNVMEAALPVLPRFIGSDPAPGQ
jgi:exosortase D (VPLPA-CTERM-specific)